MRTLFVQDSFASVPDCPPCLDAFGEFAISAIQTIGANMIGA